MKNDAFARAMGQIEREDEALKQKEHADALRQAKFAKIRKVCVILIGLALVGFAYTKRQELGQQMQKLTQASPSPSDDKVAESLKEIRGAAAKRDHALDELTKR